MREGISTRAPSKPCVQCSGSELDTDQELSELLSKLEKQKVLIAQE